METEYLCFWVSNQGLGPLSSKVNYINKIEAPTKSGDVRIFMGIVNYFRDIWRKCAHTIDFLTK